jgi:hypothetical protein
MKTLEVLLTEFNNLGNGEIHEVDVSNLVWFKAKICWESGEKALVEITNRITNPLAVEIFGTAENHDLEFYFLKYHADKVAAFQKRIDQFDADAQEWGQHHHNNYLAFYEHHVW